MKLARSRSKYVKFGVEIVASGAMATTTHELHPHADVFLHQPLNIDTAHARPFIVLAASGDDRLVGAKIRGLEPMAETRALRGIAERMPVYEIP